VTFDASRYLDLFALEAREHLAAARRLIPGAPGLTRDDPRFGTLFRHLHTLRGMAACMGFEALSETANAGENVLDGARELGRPLDARRVEALRGVLDSYAGLLEDTIALRGGAPRNLPSTFSSLADRVAAGAADAARRLDRRVEVRVSGSSVELAPELSRALWEPLLHLVRNAVDHGIEPPLERAAAGKPAAGVVTLEAERATAAIRLAVEDDGRGMESAAAEARHATGGAGRSRPSPVSGRGVGLEIVRASVSDLGGTVSIRTGPGTGTRVEIEIPIRRGGAR
jgi:chemotaxis protein histidine kinase CheA